MAWLSERQSPGRAPYRVKWRTPDGRERSRSFTKKDAAKAFLRTVEEELAAGTWIAPELGNVTVEAWTAHVLTAWNDLRPSTLERYRYVVECQIVPYLGKLPIAAVDRVVVQRWVNDLTRDGLAPATVRKAYNVLRRVFDDAVFEGRIAANPCPEPRRDARGQRARAGGIRLPKAERHEARFLTPREVKRLAAAMPDEWRAFVWIGATAGLRIGEILALRWEDVNLLRRTISVHETVATAGGVQYVNGPKTAAGRRVVPIVGRCYDALVEHNARQGGPGPRSFLFPTESGTRWSPTNFRNRAWIPACVRAGLGTLTYDRDGRRHYDGLVPHELRHTAVALWIESGAREEEVTRRAGVTSIAFVLTHYGHLFDHHPGRVNDALDALFDEGEEAG